MASSLSDIEADDIAFWAARFAEHFDFMAKGLKGAGIGQILGGAEAQPLLLRYKQLWQQVAADPVSLERREQLIDETSNIKADVKETFEQAGVPCWPDLIEHMLEELDNYFVPAIWNNEMDIAQEAIFWATEHKENLLFVGCELPQLLRENHVMPIPEKIQAMLAQNNHLAQRFQRLAANIQQADDLTPALYQEMKQLDTIHLNGIRHLIATAKNLPLQPAVIANLVPMLNHEREEAEFAIARLQRLWASRGRKTRGDRR